MQAFSQDTHKGRKKERESEREKMMKNKQIGGREGRRMDEQVPMLLVSTDTGIGACDHNFVTLACSDLQWHCTVQPCMHKHTHTDTEGWLTNQNVEYGQRGS